MFRSARWRSDKNKIKAVFKLQFHATQVEEDALMISVVPEDVGKPTARLEKALVRDGSCYWEEPVYETMKFTKEARTGKMNVKIYSFVISKITRGSSKSCVVGEASIDFATYVEATKISSVSLPLKSPKSDAILHVKIQRVLDNDSLSSEIDETDAPNVGSDNAIEAIRVHPDSPLKKLNRRVSSGSELTTTSSFSSSGIENVLQSSPSHQRTSSDFSLKMHGELQKSQWETSTDDSLGGGSSTGGDVLPTDGSGTIEKLKSEVATLSRQASLSDLELQTLRKQIIKESKRSHDLAKEVAILKEEKEAFKQECDQYKAFHKRMDEAKAKDRLHFDGGNSIGVLEELRQELNYEKDLNANLRLQLSKTQESNSELILEIRDLEETLEQLKKNNSTKETDTEEDDEEQRALEKLVNDHLDSRETHLLEQKISDLYNELQIYRRDKDELEMQIEQIALDYEILKQENHDLSYKLEQSQIQEQLKMQYECSSSSYSTINELESQIDKLENELKKQSQQLSDSHAHIQSLEEEIEKQIESFVDDVEKISQAKIEQEQRAIRAEEALRKTRLQNANTAEKLQEEFRRLSVQMASTFEANEVLASKAMSEASQLRFEKRRLEEQLKTIQDSENNNTANSSIELQKVRKKNKEMEEELKEMQKRYSEISLKFAEVEGERQQLIMTLRNIKNPKKI